MKIEEIIIKWLDHQPLSPEEQKLLDDHNVTNANQRIVSAAKKFKAPDFDIEENLGEILNKKNTHTNKSQLLSSLAKIAAILVIGLGVYFSFFNNEEDITTYKTLAGQKETIQLPNTSLVTLNSGSVLSYDASNWNTDRSVVLKGEAYFKVSKGKPFDVQTPMGTVSVLGTQFNVKQHKDFFEVICYEGLVSVSYLGKSKKLSPGNSLRVLNSKISETQTKNNAPSWIANKSTFKSMPFQYVIDAFEQQYGKKVIAKNIDKTIHFTGNFVHSDIEVALKSITIPMQLKYLIDNNTVTLYR